MAKPTAVLPVGGPTAPDAVEGAPPPVALTTLHRLVHPRRHWPAGGFASGAGWLWTPDAPARPSARLLLGVLLMSYQPLFSFWLIEMCDADDESVACSLRLMAAHGVGIFLSGWVTYKGFANVIVGGLRGAHHLRYLAYQASFSVFFSLVYVPLFGLHPFGLLTMSALLVGAMGGVLLLLFERPLEVVRSRRFVDLNVTYNVLSIMLFMATASFLYLSAGVSDGLRLPLSLGFNTVVWAIKRFAHWHPRMRASTLGLACGELWADGLTSLTLLSSLPFMGGRDFAALLIINVGTALQALLWVLCVPRRFARGPQEFLRLRATVIVLFDCLMQPACALGLLLMAHLLRDRKYFAIAHLSDAELETLDVYMLAWAASFAALGVAVSLGARRVLGVDAVGACVAYMAEFPDMVQGTVSAAFLLFGALTLEHWRVAWFMFPLDGHSA